MMVGLNEGRSYRRKLFNEIFDFSEDDSLFTEDVEDMNQLVIKMNEGGILAVASTDAIEEGPLTGMSLNMDMKRIGGKRYSCIRPAKSIRRLRLGDGDAEAIRKLFVRMQRNDPEFFYSFDLDDDSRLSNVLWVHPRSRAAYEEFNDVVSFDTAYLVNQYKLPFATIVGVNHHGQSILLGCALISHKDVNTFKWLFMTWLEAMGDVHPNSILTDQCESMRKAITEVMPNTRHRFCLWHILCNVPEKFKGVVDYDSACLEFKAIIYDSLIIEMFERNWNEFVVKHGLERNEWLSKLYVDREYWVPFYLNHTFWAGMVLTQRSESMHAYFDEEFEKYREIERLFQEASDLAYDDNKVRFVKQRLAELKQDLLSWNDGMIAPTSNAQATIDTNNVDENEENERVILNPHVTRCRG
ncbi:hypothetical protein GH714_017579 [Hevea brasiliensis]|uniref:Protein FAR1-RELATED SEQUENCE n=1 Tax=Hevea brasiliensis TaxID=3981 RepID=A0A6A6K5J5_HEVBR|nr:hypothetical protein GH714_017579 [Hevea brasiliensis]